MMKINLLGDRTMDKRLARALVRKHLREDFLWLGLFVLTILAGATVL